MSKAEAFRQHLYGRPATIKTKLSLFDNHIKPYVCSGGAPIEMVHRACRGWKSEDLSLGTIKGCLVLLAEYMKFTYQYEIDKKRLSHQYFADKVRPPQKLKVWTKDEVKIALQASQNTDPELHDLLTVVLGTGLRRGELFGLMWSDVDFIDGTICISRSKDIVSGQVGPTKTSQARRIQMSDQVAKTLEKSYTPGNEGYCFPRYFDPNAKLSSLCERANIPNISFHDLRHTFATNCLERGMSPKWVSSMLGHSKLTTTLDLYWQCFQRKVDMENIYE